MRSMPRTLVTQTEASEFFRLRPRTLESWRRRGGGPPFVQLPKGVRYRAADLEQWVAARVSAPAIDSDPWNTARERT
ncbi:MAG: helix-turn-helix domain-containing protein [Myxococcota bacterium]|jgi:hypothetical protein|nr:helix-turn-helix domain-containing protein [Myxococcota bacterium]